MSTQTSLLKSKMFWIGVLYFAEGFPLGVFYEIFPVYFRQQGVELWKIGFMSLLGLAWTLKFLWAPAIDHYRRHRLWMFIADALMGLTMLYFALHLGFGPSVWVAIGIFTILSATNDIAIDGYSIELLNRDELGRANGLRIGFYRVGMLASGIILISSDYLTWHGAYIVAAIIFALIGVSCLLAPKEQPRIATGTLALSQELRGIAANTSARAAVLMFLLGTIWLINRETHWSTTWPTFWLAAIAVAAALFLLGFLLRGSRGIVSQERLHEGPMFGALMEMLRRPYIWPVIVFVLVFKLADSAMGFMVKPFWVDSGFSATQIGLVSVNIGIVLSIAGGLAGGWFTDRVGIFTALWVLGLLQALSNLGYVVAASLIPAATAGVPLLLEHKLIMYSASALESFTGGLGTAAFLAFLMAIVDKRHAATEYAILSSVFALSRSLAGWAGGFGAHALGYAPYFLLTFFLAFPAYLLLPWVRKSLRASTWAGDESTKT